MKIIVTTSNAYAHLIPICEYLYIKYWGGNDIELVGYEKPATTLPFVSLGTQGNKQGFSTDLRKYFEQQDQFFIWLMEDTFLKSKVGAWIPKLADNIGRCDLTNDIQKREHTNDGTLIHAHPNSRYRLSTQPSIWNRDYLLQYLTPGLSPWDFETQDPKNDGWDVIGFVNPPVNHNEGVRRFDLYKLNLDGMAQEDIDHIKTLAPWMT